ncbi:MAG: EF-hand domain-containing protein [Rhodobacteraceae bacterium]|nr:EF-hand domain-containing protein [Paracoccaceae bacterium]
MKITILAAALLLPLPVLAQGNGNPGAGFIAEWDMSGTGTVTPADVTERRASLFDMFDLDGSAILEASELENMTATITDREAVEAEQGKGGDHGANGPGKVIHEAMGLAFNDADGDGQITAAEFAAASERLFPMIDRNGDGVVDMADFGRQ